MRARPSWSVAHTRKALAQGSNFQSPSFRLLLLSPVLQVAHLHTGVAGVVPKSQFVGFAIPRCLGALSYLSKMLPSDRDAHGKPLATNLTWEWPGFKK